MGSCAYGSFCPVADNGCAVRCTPSHRLADLQSASSVMIKRPLMLLAASLLLASGSFAPTSLAQRVGEDTDVSLTRRVENAILAVPALRAMDIRVGTREGDVWLTGFVNSIADILEADAITRGVRGVDAVHNHLRIADRPSRA
jgi:hyperosmotically inducible protein